MKQFYSIKDLAGEAGINYHTVYHYVRIGLMEEVGTMGEDQRVFDESSLVRLRRIIDLRQKGQSTEKIKELLAQEG